MFCQFPIDQDCLHTVIQGNEQLQDGSVKCQFWRHIKDDMYEDWANMTFTVDHSRAVEEVEVRGDSTCSVHGRRQRLQASHLGLQIYIRTLKACKPCKHHAACLCHEARILTVQEVPIDSSKPLPCEGKVVVRYKGSTAEARFELPAPGTRAACAEELPAVGWLTIGLLAADGFAVQVLPFGFLPGCLSGVRSCQ